MFQRQSAAVVAALLCLGPIPGAAQSADVFAGRPLQVVIGFGAGGGYDLWGRIVARHIGRHLPGRPTVVAQNMLGAGGLNAANHIYNVAPRDGSTIGIVSRDAVLHPLTGQKGARFDATRFSWIGSPTMETNVCIVYHTARVQSFDALLREEVLVGATGLGSGGGTYPRALNALLGTRFKLITGFKSSADVFLAMERGEVDGTCESLDSVTGKRPDWIAGGKATVLLQGGTEPNPVLKEVPFILDRARNDEERAAIRLLYAGQGYGRPFLAPPDLPPERLKLLRDAFDAAMRDAGFIAEVHAQKLDLEPRDGAHLEALTKSVYATPKHIVEKVADLIR